MTILLINNSDVSYIKAIVLRENPLLRIKRVMKSYSFGLNRLEGPDFSPIDLPSSSLPLESQYFKFYLAGPRNANKPLKCSGKRPMKNLVFLPSFKMIFGSILFVAFRIS